jgi:hypothetical protein
VINNKRAGVGGDEAVFLIFFIFLAVFVYVVISVLHASGQERLKEDTSRQLIGAQMERELTQFLQLSVGSSSVKDEIIKKYYNGDFAELEAVATNYFANRKLPPPFKSWGIIVQEPGSPSRALKLDPVAFVTQELVAQAYLPLPSPESTYLEVKLYLYS